MDVDHRNTHITCSNVYPGIWLQSHDLEVSQDYTLTCWAVVVLVIAVSIYDHLQEKKSLLQRTARLGFFESAVNSYIGQLSSTHTLLLHMRAS